MKKDTITLNKGQMMTLDEKIKYRLTTQVETVFLLTITNDVAKNVKN